MVRHIAGRDRLDTGKVVIGIAHLEQQPEPGSEAVRIQELLAPAKGHVIGWHGAMNPLRWADFDNAEKVQQAAHPFERLLDRFIDRWPLLFAAACAIGALVAVVQRWNT